MFKAVTSAPYDIGRLAFADVIYNVVNLLLSLPFSRFVCSCLASITNSAQQMPRGVSFTHCGEAHDDAG